MSNLKEEIIELAKEHLDIGNSVNNYDKIEEKLKTAMLVYSFEDFLKIYEELFALSEDSYDEFVDLEDLIYNHKDISYIQLYLYAKRIIKYNYFKIYGIECRGSIYYIANSKDDIYNFILKTTDSVEKITFYYMGKSIINKDKVIAYSESKDKDNKYSLSIYLYTEDDLMKELYQ